MNAFKQLGLLLKQNLLERRRRPIISLLEVLWPLAIVIVFVIVRKEVSGPLIPDCIHKPRALPSAGTMVFIQSLLCSLGGQYCYHDSETLAKRSLADEAVNFTSSKSKIATLLTKFQQMVTDNFEVVQALPDLISESLSLLSRFGSILDSSKNLQDFLAIDLSVRKFLKDGDAIIEMCGAIGLPSDFARVLLNSTVDLTNLGSLLVNESDARTIICRLGRSLLIPPDPTSSLLSHAMCSMNATQSASIAGLLQTQLNIDAILKTVVDMAKAFGEPGVSNSVQYIYNVLKGFSDTRTVMLFEGLQHQLSDLKGIFDIVYQFMTNPEDGAKLALLSTAGALDAVVTSVDKLLVNNSAWTDFSSLWALGKMLYKSITNTATPDNSTLPFTVAFSNPAELMRLVQQAHNAGEDFMKNLQISEVTVYKVVSHLKLLLATNASQESCAVTFSFWDMFVFPSNSATRQQMTAWINNITAIACSTGKGGKYATSGTIFNLDGMLKKIGSISRTGISSAIMQQILKISNAVMSFYSQNEPLLQALRALDYGKLWQAVRKLVDGDYSGISSAIGQMPAVLEAAQGYLKSSPHWDTIEQQLGLTDHYLDISLSLLDGSQDIFHFLQGRFLSEHAAENLLNLTEVLSQSVAKDIEKLTNWEVLQSIYRTADTAYGWQDKLCEILNTSFTTGLSNLSTEALKSTICDRSFRIFQQKIRTSYDVQPLRSRIVDLVTAFKEVPNKVTLRHANLTKIVIKGYQVVDFLLQFQNNREWFVRSTGLPSATALLHYIEFVFPDLIASTILGDVSHLAEQISRHVLTKFAQRQLEGEHNIYESAQNLSTDLLRILEQLNLTNEASLRCLTTIAGRTSHNFSLVWLSEEISKTFIDIINNFPTSSDYGTIVSDYKFLSSEANITEYIRHGAALVMATERTLINLIFWAFERYAGLSGKDTAAVVAASVHQFLSTPRPSSYFTSSAALIFDTLKTTVADLINRAQNEGKGPATSISLQYLHAQQGYAESVLQRLLSATWSFSGSRNATSRVPFFTALSGNHVAGGSPIEGCSSIINELLATLTRDSIPEANPVSLLIVTRAFEIAEVAGLNYSAFFLGRFVQTVIDSANIILLKTEKPSVFSPEKPTNGSCRRILQGGTAKSIDINETTCSEFDCESLLLLSSSINRLSATIFSLTNSDDNRRWTNRCLSIEDCATFAATLLDSFLRFAEDTALLQAFDTNWLAVANHVADFVIVTSRLFNDAISLASSFTQFWVLLPDDLKVNSLLFQLERLLLPISSEYAQESTALCRMTDALNYTAIEGHRIALQHYFCNGNVSAFLSQINSELGIPTIADKANGLQASLKNAQRSLNFNAAQFSKKIMNISNYVPNIYRNITAYLTTVCKISKLTDQSSWQRLLVNFADRVYQLAATSLQQSFDSISNNYFSTSSAGVANGNRMRRSASFSDSKNYIRNRTLFDFDQDYWSTNSSAQSQGYSIEEMCSTVLTAALQVGLPTQMLPSSTVKLQSELNNIANALSSLASLMEMMGHILRADFIELLKTAKKFDISKITALFLNQESGDATPPGDFCRTLAGPAAKATEAFDQIVKTIQDYSSLNETRLTLSLNSSLTYLESVVEAALIADSFIRAIRVAAGSGDIQQLIPPLLKTAVDYAILPSNYAKLSSLFVQKKFTEATSSGGLGDNLAEILDSVINVDAMILVLSSDPPTVDKTICASTEAMRSLFSAVGVNETIFTDVFCSKIGSLTPKSLVQSLNVSLLRQLESRRPLSLVVANMIVVGTSFLNVLNDTGLARLPMQDNVFSQLIDLLQQVAVPSNNAKLTTLTQLAVSFEWEFNRVTPYIDDRTLKSISSLIDSAIQALKAFVALQEQLKVSVRLKDIFPSNTSVLATLVSSRKRSIVLMEPVLDQTVNLNPLMSLASNAAIEEYVCSQDGLLTELHSDSVTAEDIRRAVCERDPTISAEIAGSIKQALSPQSISNKVMQAMPERLLGSDGGSLLNDSRSLLPLYQFFSKASSTMSDFKGTINIPFGAMGITEPVSGDVFVFPEHIKALSSAFCGSPVDLNLLQAASSLATRRKRSPEDEYAEFLALPSEVCQALMLTIRQQKYGRIIWAFMKPFLSGKILYTPSNDFTDFVIQKANRTFVEASQMVEFFRSLRAGLMSSALSDEAVQKLTSKTLDQPALKHPLVQKVLNKAISFNQDSIRELLQLVNKNANATATLLQLSSIIIQASACISFNRFEQVHSEDDLVTRAKVLSRNNSFLAGVVFLDSAEAGKQDVRYKIRMNRDNVPSTYSTREQVYKPDPLDDFLGNLKYLQGFVQLQDMIEQAIMDVLLNVTGATVRPAGADMRQMPAPCFYDDPFRGLMYPYLLLIIVASGYLFSVVHSIKTLVYYRQEGLDEVLKLVGVRSCTIWIAWFINNYLFMFFISGILAVMTVYFNIVPLTDPLIIFLYLAMFSFAVLSFSFLISSFFTKANMAATLGVMVYFLFFLPYAASITWSDVITPSQQMAISLFSLSAFAYGTEQITRWEQLGVGAHWSNVAKSLSFNERSLSLEWAFIWMIIDGVIYFILGWYFVSVLPSKYGAPRPWYFLFTPSFWKPEACAARNKASKSYTLPALAEEEFYNYVVGISVQGLSKTYRSKKAVADLSVDFYEGQVTAFLGKNGAGKTTTIHMLTGMRQPTSGSAYVNGMDISQDMAKIRLTMGFCPQFDILFDYMTVKEHLDYFAELKGDGQKLTAKRLLKDMGLDHVADELVQNISGGLRRRLSVALAFCGESKIIILDEPTSSVDPNGRRAIWDVILKYRPNKTIVLCTHHLDEAELISDRVAIVKEGKLLCTGSPMALKRQRSEGHKLLIELIAPLPVSPNDGSACNSPVIEFVKSSMPSAELVATNGSTKLTFRLPLENRQNYGELCKALDEQLESFGIQNYAITDCTLEQVFLAVTRENLDRMQNENPSGTTGCLSFLPSRRASPLPEAISSPPLVSDQAQETRSCEVTTPSSSAHHHTSQISLDTSPTETTLSTESIRTLAATCGTRRFVMRLRALFMKRLYHNIRNWKSYVSLLVLPCVFVGLAAMISTITPDENNRPNLVLQPSLYPGSYMFFRDSSAGQLLSEALLKKYWSDLPCLNDRQNSSSCKLVDSAKKTTCPTVPDALPVCSCAGVPGRTQQGQCDSRPPRVDEWSMNDNSVLHRVCDAYSLDAYLYSTSLIDQYKGKRIGGWAARDVDTANGSRVITTTWFDNRAYHSMPVLLNAINNAVLRSTDSRTLRNASITVSSHPITFSSASLDLTTLIRSVADAGLALFLLVAASFLPAGLLPFTVNERLGGERRQQELCGLGTGTYWLVAVVWDMLAFAVSASLMLGMVAAFGIRSYVARDNAIAFALLLILYGWASLSMAYAFARVFKSTVTAFFGTLLFSIFVGTLLTTTFLMLRFVPADIISKETVGTAANACLAMPQYALTSGLVQMTINQVQADILEPFGIRSYANPMALLTWNFTALAAEGLVFLIVALVIESCHSPCRLPTCFWPCSRTRKPKTNSRRHTTVTEDDDVVTERERAQHCDVASQAVVLRDVSRSFRSLNQTLVVVDSLSFSVAYGECFGMLGVNGAGKTTTFKMMTGALAASIGDIYILGKRITTNSSRPVIGYCPQENALDEKLTGREMLQFYGLLRGIAQNFLDKEIDRLIDAFRMSKFVERRTGTYSGGMKRTLSVALAMLGRPSLVFLDEPTAGMDPHARQVVWQQVRAYVAAGGSVILTSHSMNECDQLCDRLAIMVNGRFACIGSPQHLKNRYADGHTVLLKVKGTRMTSSAVTTFVEEQLSGANVIDSHGGVLEFFVPFSAAKLGDLYLFVERYRLQLDIVDYTISQTTLDQVFIRFARFQSSKSTSSEATSEDPEEA